MLREVTRPAHGSDEGYQRTILVHVSRTFALTIPELPPGLREAATTAYLLCRVADTIEDEPSLSAAEKVRYLTRFSHSVAVAGVEADEDLEDARALAAELAPRFSEQTSEYERDLMANMDRVIRVCRSLDLRSQKAISRCVEIMCVGMHHYQRSASPSGLPRLQDLDSYCYHVAGVVGEMLTDCFVPTRPRSTRVPPRSTAGALVWSGAADDQYPEGSVGRSQTRGLLAAAGGVRASRIRSRPGCARKASRVSARACGS